MMIVVLVIIVMILVMIIMLMSRCPLMTTVVNGWNITAMVNGPVTAMETGRAITVMVTAAISRIVIIVSRIQEMTVILVQWSVHRMAVGICHVIVALILSRLTVHHRWWIIKLRSVRRSVRWVEIVAERMIIVIVVVIVVIMIIMVVIAIAS